MNESFLVGASTVDITPAPGRQMDGYMARIGTSTGVHDPLTAQVLALEHRDRHAVLVTLDVMGVSKTFTDDLRRDLAALFRTTPDATLVCASHTHAGPSGLQHWSPIGAAVLDHDLAANVRASIRQAAEQARDSRRPMWLRSAVGDVPGIGGDRNRPERPTDARLSVLAFLREDEEPGAILFHYACHPTVLSAANLEYSADFPGAARRHIREHYPDAVCLFVNGAAGNVSTRFHRRDQSFEEVDRLGRLLGDRVIQLVAQAASANPALNTSCASVLLPLRQFPVETRQVESSGNARIDVVRTQGAAIEAQLERALQGHALQPAELCALKIGEWLLLTVPGEAFNGLALALRRAHSKALVAGYANDYLGYFPTQTAVKEATYEALASAFDARAHELLRERLVALIHHMQSG